MILRQIRDDYLLKSYLGNLFSQQAIIYDSSSPHLTFPLSELITSTQTKPHKKTFIIYQNRDRAVQYTQDHKIANPIFCQSSLADTTINLQTNSTTIMSEAHLFPTQLSTPKPVTYQQGLELVQELTEGKPAVHSDHGIGIYEGLQQKTYSKITREYLILQYAAGDTLAVPVEYAHKVTAYLGQSTPAINRLHATAWAKTKKAARADAIRFARELIQQASQRAKTTGRVYEINPRNETQLESTFPYQLTIDQAKAWREVREDLISDNIMDRLVVGDVGFGKTEIALRAAYHVAQANHQVAILAPTTLLVQQHADTFINRLPTIKDNIGILSRFASPKHKKAIQEKISSGQLNIIIGFRR